MKKPTIILAAMFLSLGFAGYALASASSIKPSPSSICPGELSPEETVVALQQYRHCETASDCTIIHGGKCGFHSGTPVNKTEVEHAQPLIDTCLSVHAQQACQEDPPGFLLD